MCRRMSSKKFIPKKKTFLDPRFIADGNYVYFNDIAHRRISVTDMNFENERTIFEYDSKHSVAGLSLLGNGTLKVQFHAPIFSF